MSIAIRDLKAKLSSVLARARQGEIIEVTSHNKPIARITGIPMASDHSLAALVNVGMVSWNGQKPRLKHSLPQLSSEDKSVSRMVLEDRT